MIKPYHVKDYIKSGIADNVMDAEGLIEAIVEDIDCSILEVEFVDYDTSSMEKSKYRITIELIG